MNKLYAISWLSILVAVVPFLAVPLWLTRLLLVILALAILLLSALLYYTGEGVFAPSTQALPGTVERPNDSPERAPRTDPKAGGKGRNPKKATESDADRVARYNSYASRQDRLG